LPLYKLGELDPNRHIKQTADQLAETAERIRKEVDPTLRSRRTE
jgi:hypothetical protein